MKKENFYKKPYFIGIDAGTDSIGYAVSYEDYTPVKFHGEPMWGTTVFESAKLCNERRGFRTARRRLNRRQHRVELIKEILAPEIIKVDTDFFVKLQESNLFAEDKSTIGYDFLKDEEFNGKKYGKAYPTIHHLIFELMCSSEPHDIRLVYIACAWLVAHRGHFLSEVNKENIGDILDFEPIYNNFINHFCENEYSLPWNVDSDAFSEIMKNKCNITEKEKKFFGLLTGGKKPKSEFSEENPYSIPLMIKLLSGGKVKPSDLFDKEEYSELESISLGMADDKFSAILSELDEDSEIILLLKAMYDWSLLTDMLKGKKSISEAKIEVYNQHKQDLHQLKKFIKKYCADKYSDIFRKVSEEKNYAAYSGHTDNEIDKSKLKKANREDFSEYLKKIIKDIKCDSSDETFYNDMCERLGVGTFLPKQVNGDNRVIPYQLYWYELKKILENASKYCEFLNEKDEDGISTSEKILSVFEFRVPYYVGPLNEKSDFAWLKRKASGKIYPWNFDKKVDFDSSEEEFIRRMTNMCTYLPGEYVLPKNSLLYTKFEVLNEINNIKVNGEAITVENKKLIYSELFEKTGKVTPKKLITFMERNGICEKTDVISGIDINGNINSSLKPYIDFRNLIENGKINLQRAEKFIAHSSCSEDKLRLKKWIENEFSDLSEEDIKYLTRLKYKNFGRLSERLLNGTGGTCKDTEEVGTIIDFLWNTNDNLMQILSDKYTFMDEIEKMRKEYYSENSLSTENMLDDMYISNSVKRPIIRAESIIKEIVGIIGYEPKKVFIEMARGAEEGQKNKRTKTRYTQITELYENIKSEEVKLLSKQLKSFGDTVDNCLQSDVLFLYFTQLGKCMYSEESIDIELLKSSKYNVDHIYPQSYVKDDSILNNKVLVLSTKNSDKGDVYPVPGEWRNKMSGFWHMLNESGLITDEKYKRLTRTTPFSESEKYGFINRQLVETRQSTKALAEVIKAKYKNTEVVYVKAGLVSEFRHKYDIVKCRSVNDLHHAKDAYLNIVVGNVYNERFTKRFNVNEKYSLNYKVIFGNPFERNGTAIWDGENSIAEVKKRVLKNNIHYTRYSFCRKGGLFDQNPVKAAPGLVPLKKNLPTEKYGGYAKTAASFFVPVKYTDGKKYDIMIMPVELMYSDRFLTDKAFAEKYAADTVGSIMGKTVNDVSFPLGKRILKINTVFCADGLELALGSKAGGGKQLGIIPLTPLIISGKYEAYIKKLDSFFEKRKKNQKIVVDSDYDGITAEKNIELYNELMNKLSKKPYSLMPNCQHSTLENGFETFRILNVVEQIEVLVNIVYILKTGRTGTSDLSLINGSKNSGVMFLSSNLRNWKKIYTDIRIVDYSPTGIFRKESINLLDLL